MPIYAENPIMPGFYPDPSICAVDGDYYMTHSTFAYFPGLPIMHSRDLVHWEQIGNAMHRASQLPLEGAKHSGGLFAPTIRYHDGMFYMICTNVSHGGNYIVTAANPEGPWSEPYYLEGADGIDPSLFFDDDGKCYYIGTHPNPEGCRYNGDWYIWIQELDTDTMKLTGEHRDVWNGALRDVIWPEGPHLYKKDGYYYIMNAEGGTGPDHAVTVCRSRNIMGPYENNPRNPVLTHRHLGKAYPIRYVGHADMFRTPVGEWYMIMLAVRPIEGYTTMGRETFLAKVVWEDGWPVVNPGEGRLTERVEIDLPEWNPLEDTASYTFRTKQRTCVPGSSREYRFPEMRELGEEFLFLRNPSEDMYELREGEGLYLRFGRHTLREAASPSYIAVRQQHHRFEVKAEFSTKNLQSGRKAGLALVQSDQSQLRVEVSEGRAEVILCEGGTDRCVGGGSVSGEAVVVYLKVEGLLASAGTEGEGGQVMVRDLDIRSLSTEVSGGFVGCCIGLYAAAEGQSCEERALYKSFSYHAL